MTTFFKRKRSKPSNSPVAWHPSPSVQTEDIPETKNNNTVKLDLYDNIPNFDEKIKKLQESEQESLVKKLRAELDQKNQMIDNLEKENQKKLQEQQDKLNELNANILKMQELNNASSPKSIEDENNQLSEKINKLKEEKAKLDEQITKKQVICDNLEAEVKKLNQEMRALPHYQQIKKLQEYMSQLERETNEKLASSKKQTEVLNSKLEQLRDELDQYNLTAEDLQNQNSELYDQRTELRSQLQSIFLEYQKQSLAIQAQGTYIPIERYNLEISNAKKANQKSLEKHRQVWNKFLEKLRTENDDLKKEIVVQDQIVSDLKDKFEKLSHQYDEIKASKQDEIQSLKRQKAKAMENLGFQAHSKI
ncbi:hypothetical protein TVAGG3_0996610 [Trichomonas vaginalis G3]|uniref:hypothetical protein n=1 Tax=Trichomonas vaginalis (strain ATCC PRA-98 / G3) TaxID=412133 RepID=UPI0021E62638|nr:hypothetical protein TVAGG3_0996610 [Trichomonas vaginalis G3]KAI5490437.1 hypothetical protein TVAGG3_0996610 [Trichomonas vaginalis G3]